MSRKVNPIILRMGINKTWESRYVGNLDSDVAKHQSKATYIEKFIKEFLYKRNFVTKKLKIGYSDNKIKIFISYFEAQKKIKKKNNLKLTKNPEFNTNFLEKLKRKKEKFKKITGYKTVLNRKQISKFIFTTKKNKKNATLNSLKYYDSTTKSAKRYLSHIKSDKAKKRRLIILKHIKTQRVLKKKDNLRLIENRLFLRKLTTALKQYFNRNMKINVILNEVKNVKRVSYSKEFNKKKLVKTLSSLRKFEKNWFFKEGVNVISACINSQNSAKLLSNFISEKLAKLHRHNFFLKFVKKMLSALFLSNLSKIKGAKIQIKGRFNGAPRARIRRYFLKKGVPVLAIKSNIDYSESVSYTKNGTFGVKVWVWVNENTTDNEKKEEI